MVLLAVLAFSRAQAQQTSGATFGEVIALGGTPSDIVLDEQRGRLYIVSDSGNRVNIFDINEQRLVSYIGVGQRPVAASMSMDGNWLYVTNNVSSSLSVIDLGTSSVNQIVQLPSRPEGVEVGADGRVLINMVGSGVVNGVPQGTLAIFDRNQQQSQQLIPVDVPALPTTPAPLPPTVLTRPITTFAGKLIRTPDGQFIVGVITPTDASTYLFVYEVASGVILRNRTVAGQSSVLSMSPDGSRFMAGLTMFDTATLGIVGQYNNANAPFTFNAAFNIRQNIGGSAFTSAGSTLYSAFNVAAFASPAPRPQSSTLLVSDARNLGIRLGIKLPESIVAKMVITADGSRAWGMSESGLLYMPLGTLYDYPILQPETTQVFLSLDECSRGIARGTLRINNIGSGKLTFSIPNTGSALVAEASSGLAPATIAFSMEPGRSGVLRRPGTNIWTNAGTFTGNAFNLQLASADAINLPPMIRVYMNYRQPDQRGVIYPVPTTPNNSPLNTATASGNEGLQDLLLDEARGRLYVTNAGYNRIEVFDLYKQRFVDPIPVGQLPHQMALGGDGRTLYVGNMGGESISIVDLDLGTLVGQVDFPPIPRNGTVNLIYPRTLAVGLFGLQFIMSDGSKWKIINNQAAVRLADGVTPETLGGAPVYSMLASPGSEYILALAGNGQGFLYDSLLDTYTAGRLLFSAPIQGYFGVLSAAASGSFFLANGLIMNSSMTIVGGSERPGSTTFTPPGGPGQPPTISIVNTGQRNVAAVAALDDHRFLRLTTPVRQAITTATRDDERATLELLDFEAGSQTLVGPAPENPVITVLGTQRANVPPRQMVVDSQGTAYIITLSGLSVIGLAQGGTGTRPQIAQRGVVNSNDGTASLHPGSFLTIAGANLGSSAKADIVPPPTVLGGSCVTFGDIAVPLLETSPGQILAQIPENLRFGTHVVQVRSLATAQASDPVIVSLTR